MRLLGALLAFASCLVAPSAAAGPARIPVRQDHCRLPAARTATPIGTGACPGVRPGAFFRSPVAGCSFNFLFKGSDGARYIGTAGHCLLSSGGQKRWRLGTGPVITDSAGRTVGRGAFAILEGDRDFALIRLNRGVPASAQMCHFGGPVGIDRTYRRAPMTLEHYGNAIAVSGAVPARTALVLDTTDPNITSAIGAAAFGDSGSGATLNGRAFGVVVALGLSNEGYIFITRIPPQLEIAEEALRIKLTLQTARRL
jgi:hypothetical protein